MTTGNLIVIILIIAFIAILFGYSIYDSCIRKDDPDGDSFSDLSSDSKK